MRIYMRTYTYALRPTGLSHLVSGGVVAQATKFSPSVRTDKCQVENIGHNVN